MKIRTIALVALTLAATVGAATWTLASTAGADAPAMNRFTETCPGPTVNRQVDPVVSFGVAVSAHPHTESGNQNFSSTMSAKDFPPVPGHEADPGYNVVGSNCATYGDWSGYWFPTAYLNGVELKQAKLLVTWQTPAGAKVSVAPFGMLAVVGDSKATMEEPGSHVAWTCGNIDVTWPMPHDCANIPGGVVTAQITYPDCWDGVTTFDAPAGIAMSHFSYDVNGVCPPVPGTPNSDGNDEYRGKGPLIAQLVTQQTFLRPDGQPLTSPVDADGHMALTFSSGQYFTYHGDLEHTPNHDEGDFVNACLNKGDSSQALQITGQDPTKPARDANKNCITGQTKVNNILIA